MRTLSLTATLRHIPAMWPQFSLRTLFISVTLVSITLGWYIPRVQNERRAANAILAAHGETIYDWQIRPEDAPPDYQSDPPGPNFLRAWFGSHWFDTIVEVRLNGNANQVPKSRFSYVGPHLVNLPSLRELCLWGTLDASDYQLLIQLRQVESLRLGMASELTPANAATLARMPNLKALYLNSAKILPPALAELSRLPNLEKLLISCDSYHRSTGNPIEEYQLRDDAAAAIAAFPKLRKVNLYSTRITDVGIADICRNSKLDGLEVSSRLITSASFDHVVKLQRLRHFGPWGWKIEDADLDKLAALPHLESLCLFTPLTDNSIPHVVRLTHLKRLAIDGEQVTDASLPLFHGMQQLTRLNLHDTGIDKLSQAAKDLHAALPNCFILLPRTPREEAMHQAFIASKWSGGNSLTYQPKNTALASPTVKKE